jgi:hypothetical protein
MLTHHQLHIRSAGELPPYHAGLSTSSKHISSPPFRQLPLCHFVVSSHPLSYRTAPLILSLRVQTRVRLFSQLIWIAFFHPQLTSSFFFPFSISRRLHRCSQRPCSERALPRSLRLNQELLLLIVIFFLLLCGIWHWREYGQHSAILCRAASLGRVVHGITRITVSSASPFSLLQALTRSCSSFSQHFGCGANSFALPATVRLCMHPCNKHLLLVTHRPCRDQEHRLNNLSDLRVYSIYCLQ